MVKKSLTIVLGLAALILNPFFACSAFEPGFNFGAGEMRAAVEGTWTITAPAAGDRPAMAYTVRIAQGDGTKRSERASLDGLVAPAAACGSRSLVRPAAACIDDTRMPLDVQIVNGASARPSSGEMVVYGLSFDAARLDLVVDGTKLRGQLSRTGVVTDLASPEGERPVQAHMVRIAPGT